MNRPEGFENEGDKLDGELDVELDAESDDSAEYERGFSDIRVLYSLGNLALSLLTARGLTALVSWSRSMVRPSMFGFDDGV